MIFLSSKLKIERADKHIRDLNSVIISYLNTHVFTPEPHYEAESSRHTLRFHADAPIPWDIPLIIGDAIHNIRSALDILVCDMIRFYGGTPTRWTRLPFTENRQKLVNTLNGGIIKSFPMIYDYILCILKPYDPCNGGDCTLWPLHNLSIKDKHEMIIPIVAGTQTTGVSGTMMGGNIVFTGLNFHLTGGQFNSMETPGISSPDVKFTNHGQTFFNVAFGNGQPFENQAVVPTLLQLSEFTSKIIDDVATRLS